MRVVVCTFHPLMLMFCYDPRFLGQSHPVTIAVGGASSASFFIFCKNDLRVFQKSCCLFANAMRALQNRLFSWRNIG